MVITLPPTHFHVRNAEHGNSGAIAPARDVDGVRDLGINATIHSREERMSAGENEFTS